MAPKIAGAASPAAGSHAASPTPIPVSTEAKSLRGMAGRLATLRSS